MKKQYSRQNAAPIQTQNNGKRRKLRKHLNADRLLAAIRKDFSQVKDYRSDNCRINLADALMSGLAVFQLKYPTLLAFDNDRLENPENLRAIFGIRNIPCDSQMRSILDPIDLSELRKPFRTVIGQLQRGKELEKFKFLNDHYLLSCDGTGFYTSDHVTSDRCMAKTTRGGVTQYYQQMYAAAFVHPDNKVVLPTYPEMITRQDGSTKNDCERNAAKRYFDAFRKDHPHLKVIVVEDALASNGPHIRELQKHDLRFILGVKPGDHKALFSEIEKELKPDGQASNIGYIDKESDVSHQFNFFNGVALNKSNPDLLVNFLEYWQIRPDGKTVSFSWVTDIQLTAENVQEVMRAGRARWKIENETFNTLKNQGYHLGHNFGLGKKNLSGVFTTLMMLAFLVDQTQQMSCWLYRDVAERCKTKKRMWAKIRSRYDMLIVDSFEMIFRSIVEGLQMDVRERYSP